MLKMCEYQSFHCILYSLLNAGVTGGGESDIGSIEGMMPEEVEAAFQEFLNEQKTNGDAASKS